MPITNISRNFNGSPDIVFIQSTDDLTTLTTPGYITSQQDNIEIFNKGPFTFLEDDFCLINYADGEGFFNVSLTSDTLVPSAPPSGLSNSLSSAHLFIGNASNIATDVPMTGDGSMSNTGVFTLANTAITPGTYTVNGETLFTVDSKGRLTFAANAVIDTPPSGSAGGDLSGTYPNPALAKISGVPLDLSTLDPASFLIYSGTTWKSLTISGRIGITAAGYAVVLGLGNYPIFDATPTSGNLLLGDGSGWSTRGMSGDGTITFGGLLTVTKTGGVSFAPSATTDTTNASNISSGTLSNSRLPNSGVTAASYTINGSTFLTVDAKGIITSATDVTIPADSVTISTNIGGPLTGLSFTFSGGSTGLVFSGSGNTASLTGNLGVNYGGTNATTAANARSNLGVAWELVSTASASSSASVSFTGLSSTYSSYMLLLKNVLPATDATTLMFRTSTDNGSNYDAGANDYYYTINFSTYGSGIVQNAFANTTNIGIGGRDNVSISGTNGTLMIMSHATANPCHLHFSGNGFESTAGALQSLELYGLRNSSTAVDALQILFSSGNIATGDFYLYGLKASTV